MKSVMRQKESSVALIVSFPIVSSCCHQELSVDDTICKAQGGRGMTPPSKGLS